MTYQDYFSSAAQSIQECSILSSVLLEVEEILWNSLESGGKIIWCGNGGSASDSQHLAAELVGRFAKNRRALASISLSTDTSILTSLSNDFGFETIFSRQIEALGNPDDVLIGISTSGKSLNVINAVTSAKEKGIKTIALTGEGETPLSKVADISIFAPSSITSHIQECHIAIGQALCGALENRVTT
jgi:D-sedoheptulose 7-phosphate isomerase